jgi:hypothetical protein
VTVERLLKFDTNSPDRPPSAALGERALPHPDETREPFDAR